MSWLQNYCFGNIDPVKQDKVHYHEWRSSSYDGAVETEYGVLREIQALMAGDG